MTATPWPNNLGWDVGDYAEVWRLANGLGVRIYTDDYRIKHLFIPNPLLDARRKGQSRKSKHEAAVVQCR